MDFQESWLITRHAVTLYFMLLQLLPCAFDAPCDAGDGGWPFSDHVWRIEELCGLLPKVESGARQVDRNLLLKALNGE